jgi:hypothetical protein
MNLSALTAEKASLGNGWCRFQGREAEEGRKWKKQEAVSIKSVPI